MSDRKKPLIVDASKSAMDFYDAAWVWVLYSETMEMPVGSMVDDVFHLHTFYSEDIAMAFLRGSGINADSDRIKLQRVDVGSVVQMCGDFKWGYYFYCKDGSREKFKVPRVLFEESSQND